ncbi:hypothetical protein ACJIZ3_011357 [Penstemon smallii]|uniref:Uncharacterized protein n=1 Tax=Penstemon smallii TaxID=265156 RepID=A0ABD3UMG1_9LAMI
MGDTRVQRYGTSPHMVQISRKIHVPRGIFGGFWILAVQQIKYDVFEACNLHKWDAQWFIGKTISTMIGGTSQLLSVYDLNFNIYVLVFLMLYY